MIPIAVRDVTRACALVGALTALLPADATAEWRRLDAPNFIVVGDVGARDLREVAVQFEGFRETLGRVLSDRVTATAVPTVVIVFPHDRAFTPYKPLYKGKPAPVAGVFYGGSDVNYIALTRESGGSLRIIFHEYAHLVISNVATNLPVWLSEGLAEYYSTYDVSRGGRQAVIGRPIEPHVHLLREKTLVPLDQLIAVDRGSPLYNEENRQSLFYAQSWALTHMLMLGDPPRTKELTVYMRLIQQGVPAGDAWRQAFGGIRIDQDLWQHIRRQSFKAYAFRFDDGLTAVQGDAQPMTQPDVAAFLAGLRIRQGRLNDAVAEMGEAGTADSHPHTQVVTAQADLLRGDIDSVVRRLVPPRATGDWFVSYLAGLALTDAIERGREAPADRLAAGRAYLDAVKTVREVPNALANRAMLDLHSPEGPTADTRATIERARALAPGRPEYVLIHARVLAESGEFPLARNTLSPMLAPGFPPHIRETARNWLGRIVQMESNRRGGVPAAAGAGGDRSSPAAPGGSVIPVYRTVQPHEQRIEGQLESILCAAGGLVRFLVRADDGTHTIAAPKIADVEFITYREDLKGGVACGPLKPPARVYVTWKAGDDPASRVVVAVEFLPVKQP